MHSNATAIHHNTRTTMPLSSRSPCSQGESPKPPHPTFIFACYGIQSACNAPSHSGFDERLAINPNNPERERERERERNRERFAHDPKIITACPTSSRDTGTPEVFQGFCFFVPTLGLAFTLGPVPFISAPPPASSPSSFTPLGRLLLLVRLGLAFVLVPWLPVPTLVFVPC